jgi:hypothetical protein
MGNTVFYSENKAFQANIISDLIKQGYNGVYLRKDNPENDVRSIMTYVDDIMNDIQQRMPKVAIVNSITPSQKRGQYYSYSFTKTWIVLLLHKNVINVAVSRHRLEIIVIFDIYIMSLRFIEELLKNQSNCSPLIIIIVFIENFNFGKFVIDHHVYCKN